MVKKTVKSKAVDRVLIAQVMIYKVITSLHLESTVNLDLLKSGVITKGETQL